ncbi:adipokinetic hormone-3 [Roseibium sp. TrichSKD4]|nr:adipokinetic hormone-3 [Roseibium sp. TrichSKD4]
MNDFNNIWKAAATTGTAPQMSEDGTGGRHFPVRVLPHFLSRLAQLIVG